MSLCESLWQVQSKRHAFWGKGNSAWPAGWVKSTWVWAWHLWKVAERSHTVKAPLLQHIQQRPRLHLSLRWGEKQQTILCWVLCLQHSRSHTHINQTPSLIIHNISPCLWHLSGGELAGVCVCVRGLSEHYGISFPPSVPGLTAEQVRC